MIRVIPEKTGRISAPLDDALDRLLLGRILEPFTQEDGLDAPTFERLEKLRLLLCELQDYSVSLSQGDVDAPAPSRRNYLASGVKQLQAQLRHLTWQAQCIAGGDYGQQIDFMGEFSQAFNTMRDQLAAREEGLIAQRNAMFAVFDTIEPIIVVHAENRDIILYANHMARIYFGVDPDAPLRSAKGNTPGALYAMEPTGTLEIEEAALERWFSVSCAPLPWSAHENALLFHCIDITAHKERETSLEREANTDPMTGLLNRRAFEQALAREWDYAQRVGAPISFLIFDIDRFKLCNDTYGHAHGDACLYAFAQTLQKCISRSRDVVARFGGEEFVALLPDTDEHGAITVAELVRKAAESLSIPFEEDYDVMTKITVSAGVSTVVPSPDIPLAHLALMADKALYTAKETGRNKVCARAVAVVLED